MLEIRGLEVDRGPSRVLRGLDIDVAGGGVTALIGANGAGKTTTLMAVSGLLPARGGRITLHANGQVHDLLGADPAAIVGLGVVHCPEGRQVFASLTVEENLRAGAFARRNRDTAHDLARVHALFPVLAERRRQRAGSLSGGEQMMLALGRALMAAPRLLLLDEPSLGLAPNLVARIFATIQTISAEGVPVLLVEQNAHAALSLAKQAYVLEGGRIARAGRGSELLADPAVREAYLGIGA